MRDRWIVVGIVLSTLLGCFGFFSYITNPNAQKRDLRKAVEFEDMSKYDEASKSYEQHLHNYPTDIIAQFRSAMIRRRLHDEGKCVDLLLTIADELSELKRKERETLRSNKEWDILLETLIETATSKIVINLVRESYIEEIQLILSKEYSDIYDRLLSGKCDNRFKVKRALSGLAVTQARYSFLQWLDGEPEWDIFADGPACDARFLSFIISRHKLKEVRPIERYVEFSIRLYKGEIVQWITPSSISEWEEERARSLASLLLRIGKDKFEKGEYRDAREAFTDAINYVTHGGIVKGIPLVSDLKYHRAITYWYEGDLISAGANLLALQKESPEYERRKVTEQIIDAKEKIGNSRFEQGRYREAREAYENAIAYCMSVGYKKSHSRIAEFIYKIAKTHGMEGDYFLEKSTLLHLRNSNQKYKSKFIIVRPVIR